MGTRQKSCDDCAHCSWDGLIRWCEAPELRHVLDTSSPTPQNTMTPCEGARDFKIACGREAKWFKPKGE